MVVQRITDPSGVTKAETTASGQLHENINVAVVNLAAWETADHIRSKQDFTLYLDGRKMPGVTASPLSAKSDHLRFELIRTGDPDNKAAWTSLLSRPTHAGKPMSISIGLDGQLPVSTSATFVLDSFPRFWLLGWMAFMLGLLILFFYAAANSDLLRDGGNPPPADTLPPSVQITVPADPLNSGPVKAAGAKQGNTIARRPYSLGRSQMAFWFVIVLGAFTFIWMVTGDEDTITPTVLSLIGISSATGLAAALVDKSSVQNGGDQRRQTDLQTADLKAQQKKLETDLASAAGTPAAAQAQQTLDQINARIAQDEEKAKALPNAAPASSRGFWIDILDDANGLTLHRFQIFLWTLVLGVVFVRTVYESLAMPDFSATLLGLMGISSGTYLGFKFPESKG